MGKIKTTTGKEFLCNHVSVMPSPNMIFINIEGSNISEVATVFSDSNETSALWWDENYFAYYNTLKSIAPLGGAIQVCLSKE